MTYGTRDGMTWHVVRETFPVQGAEERAVIWLCGGVESGSESLGVLRLTDTVPEEGLTCDVCRSVAAQGVGA